MQLPPLPEREGAKSNQFINGIFFFHGLIRIRPEARNPPTLRRYIYPSLPPPLSETLAEQNLHGSITKHSEGRFSLTLGARPNISFGHRPPTISRPASALCAPIGMLQHVDIMCRKCGQGMPNILLEGAPTLHFCRHAP